jgi:hypothetical protein
MRAIRNNLLGKPPVIRQKTPKAKVTKPEKPTLDQGWGMTDDEWRAEADNLWDKTLKDGNEHLKLFNNKSREYTGTKKSVGFSVPGHKYNTLHTHPNWDSPLSPKDMTNFIASKQEQFSGAATKNSIYIIRKNQNYTGMTYQAEEAGFNRLWRLEVRRQTKALQSHTLGFPDMTEINLNTGKVMAKKFGLDYKVIKRKP